MKKFFNRQTVLIGLLAGALVTGVVASGNSSNITALKLEEINGSWSFVIAKSGAVDIQEFMMEDPPRLVVDFIGVTHELTQSLFDGDGNLVSKVRTSQFTSEPDAITRVVFDLKKSASYKLVQQNEAVVVQFFDKDASKVPSSVPPVMNGSVSPVAAGAANPAVNPAAEAKIETKLPPVDVASDVKPMSPSKPAATGSTMNPPVTMSGAAASPATKPAASPKPVQTDPAMSWNTVSTPKEKGAPVPAKPKPQVKSFESFAASDGMVNNKTITIDVQNADVKTVLRSLSEFSGTNIISGPEVEGEVTAHLKNVPWRQALEIILKSHGFGQRDEYGVIRVSTMENLVKEELELEAAARKKDDLLPLVTNIIPLSFSNAEEMRTALKEMLSVRGSMEVEKGNNALIVTDISKNNAKIASMVAELDRKIDQVEIVAKMVDVDYEASEEMGIRWDALNLSLKDAPVVADAVIKARAANPVGTFRIGTVQSWGEVQAIVDLMAKENKANIISNPRIVTANNREASILVGKEIPLIVSDEAGNPITELTKVGIILRVTPHVNSDNTITLDLHPEVSELSAQATVQGGVVISLSEADTRVVVNDGDTAVIGGLINEVESEFENGVPVLKDIPVVGNLFKIKSQTKKKRELIIFVTPTVVTESS